MVEKTLGHYRILEKIGEGGMGEVYKARDTRLDRDIAIKVLPPDVAAQPERRERFEREAKAVAGLKHPNIVTVHSVEQDEGTHFLTMELVEGKSLSDAIPPDGLSLSRLFELAIPLADAVSEAHAKGITHRDLKPANIMLDHEGRVKVLDFGLAKAFSPAGEGDDATLAHDDGATGEGRILGTVAYMSPEQAEGKNIDHRTDIFSLGIVLYEMAAGVRPFEGDTPISTISSIIKDTPASLTELKQALPRHLARIVNRCLEKKPDRRFQTARDVCNELRGLKKEVASGEHDLQSVTSDSVSLGKSAAVTHKTSLWGKPWVWVIVGMLFIALVYAIYEQNYKKPQTTDLPLSISPLTGLVGFEGIGSWSPDGSFFAFSHSKSGPMDIYVRSTAGGDPVAVVRSEGDDSVARWSPDNRWIAFCSGRGAQQAIYLVPPLGGTEQKLTETGLSSLESHGGDALGASPWYPDGKSLLFSRVTPDGGCAVWRIELESGQETQLSKPSRGARDITASLSFNGARIVFSRVTESGSMLMVMSSGEGGDPRVVLEDAHLNLQPAWSPDDRSIVFASNRGGSYDVWMIQIESGSLRQLTSGTQDDDDPVISPDGRILYKAHSHQTDLYLKDLESDEGEPLSENRLTLHTRDNFSARFSPDGNALIYMSTRTGNSEIWWMDLNSRNERQLTNHPAADHSPDWSPNGKEVLFFSDRDDAYNLWVISVEGGAPRRLVEIPRMPAYEDTGLARWSPDGSVIGYLVPGESGPALWTVDRNGGNAKKILEGVMEFDWYRDKGHIIYTPSAHEDSTKIRVVNLETGKESLLMDAPHVELVVARDGSGLSYCSASSHFNMNLHVLKIAAADSSDGLPRPVGEPEKITHGEGQWHVHNGDFSPDGKRVVYTRDTDMGDIYLLEGVF